MHFRFNNVNDAFNVMVARVSDRKGLIETSSRNGPVLQFPEPVIVTYRYPLERVLFNQARDANPFFHLYEALWMLAGRNDLAPLQYYVSTFDQFSDDGKVLNGAYGHRWRKSQGDPIHRGRGYVDQLGILIDHLKTKPDSRRAVLQMWNVDDDLMKIHFSKDVCCNLSAMFMINLGKLDMTVTNRSNDMILGMFGANLVHFSILHEYLAACIGVPVGVYNQFSNNLHVYTETYNSAWLEWERMHHPNLPYEVPYEQVPLVDQPARFDDECLNFVERHSDNALAGSYQEPFLRDVAQPMCVAFHHHKRRDYRSALLAAESIRADDWRWVAEKWLEKRRDNWLTKTRSEV